MTSRRAFLQAGLTGGALLAMSDLTHAFDIVTSDRLYKAIFDERFPAAVAFARDMRRRGIATHGINGDITALWYHDLHFAWAQAPICFAGVTTASALFCLETLARDAGHCVTSRQIHEDGLVTWTIGPRGGTTNG
jgi:hypothetical protein